MISRIYPRGDFSMGLQNASSWKLRQPNELEDGRNLRFNDEIGAIVRRNGYVQSGQPFSASGKLPCGFHTAQFTTGAKRFVAVPAEDDSATLVKVQESNGSWTTLINDLPIGVDVYFTDYRDEVYVSGYTVADDVPFQPRNINKDLDVSITRNLLFAPWAKYYVVYRGVLYATNVKVGGQLYPDRFYKASAPTGAITFVRGDQTDTLVPLTFINQVPIMTSMTTPTGVVAHSQSQSTWEGYKVFKQVSNRSGGSWFTNGGTATGWVSYDFGATNPKVITDYMLRPLAASGMEVNDPSGAPRTWQLQGSNNNTTWTDIHSITNAPPFIAGEERTYNTTNTTAYRYYRINVTQSQGTNAPGGNSNWVTINGLKLYTTLQTVRPLQLNIDSTRYIKPGMALDIYRAGKDTKLYDMTVYDVDKPNNTITFLPDMFTISAVSTANDTLTVPSTDKIPTGTPIKFASTSTLPSPLAPSTTYYAIKVDATNIKVATTLDNATIGQAIDITTTGATGSVVHSVILSYVLKNNDELYLDNRKDVLTTFWNTDYPTPDKADWSAVQPGADSSIAITGAQESANRLFVFTLNSTTRFDGTNPVPLSKTIGCASMRSIKNLDDDWMVWLTARGRVYARNEAGGQQEYISRGLYNKFFGNLTLAQLKAASAGITDGEYILYVGDYEGEPHRAVYDFGSNTWSIDALGHRSYMYANDVADGIIKPFFVSDDGKLYQDDTGNKDGDKVTRIQIDLGKTNYGTNNDKYFQGHYIYSKYAKGLKIVIRIDDGEPMVVGEIAEDWGDIIYKIDNNRNKFKGSTIAVSLKGAVEGPPQIITSVDDYFNMVQEINAHAKRQ